VADGFNSAPIHPKLPDMQQFSLTERAAARIAEIMAEDGKAAALRVAVLAGGCSGFQYRFELDQQTEPDDLLIEQGQAKVVVDPVSLDLLAGAELDYTDELMGSHFAIRNPNATAACGCGTSFSIE
jgi:iron-sulfur cluster insertion protein